MYRARTKKQEFRRLIITYTVVPVIIAVGVALLVMYTVGYRYNQDDHRLEQGGLVQFISQPTGAMVEVDGVRLSGDTNTRLDAAAGSHTVIITKPGYRTWQKTVTVEPGMLLWLNYVRLIPEELKISPVITLDKLDSSIASYQKDQLVLLEDNTKPELTVVDTSSQKASQRTVAIDSDLYLKDASVRKFSIDSIDKSGRYVVVKAMGKATQWLVIDLVHPTQSQNISTIASEDMTGVMFYPNNTRILYVIIKNTLRQINLDEQTASAPLVSNIRDVSMSHEGVIAYVTSRDEDTNQRQVGYYTAGASKSHVLRRIYDTGKQPVEFRIGDYNNGSYGVLRFGDNLEIFSFKSQDSDAGDDSSTSSISTIALSEGSDFLSISPSGRFILSQESSSFITYDLELMKVTTSTLKGDTAVDSQLQWLDSYHIWSDRGGRLYVYEFDGENAQMIDGATKGQSVLLSKGGKQLWYVDTVDSKLVIKSAQLID